MDKLRRIPREGIEKSRWDSFLDLMHDVQLRPVPDGLGSSLDISDSFLVSPARCALDSGFLLGRYGY